MIIYQKRELNLDGTWKENLRARSKLKEGMLSRDFHFLEYANQGDANFKNPLEVLKGNKQSQVGLQLERHLVNRTEQPGGIIK